MKEEGLLPPLPDLSVPDIVHWLMEVGPVVAGPMGSTAIGWPDIVAWQLVSGIELKPWQASLIRRLSAEYLGEWQEASDPERPAPWTPDVRSEAHRASVADKVRVIFGARARG